MELYISLSRIQSWVSPSYKDSRKHSSNLLDFDNQLSDGNLEFNNFIFYIERSKITLPEKAKNCINIIVNLFQSKNKIKNLDLNFYLIIRDHHEFISDFVYISNNYRLQSLWKKYTESAYNYRNFIKSLKPESYYE